MNDLDEKIIVDKKEHMDLIAEKYYLMGRIAELEKQVDVLKKVMLGVLNQNKEV